MKPEKGVLRSSGLSPVMVTILFAGAAWLLLAEAQGVGPLAGTWTRTQEPVILTGEQLARFNGVALNELFVYRYRDRTWTPIPFQVDEVNAFDRYTIEDGHLDANDELVFMAMDLGQEASPSEWIADNDSRSHVRYQVQVSNPLSSTERGWVYVYHSSTLHPTIADYVKWDEAGNRIVARSYVAGIDPELPSSLDTLELNGSGVDALDRIKIRVHAACRVGFVPIPVMLTEEDLDEQIVAWDVDGPVRVGGGTKASATWAYHSLFEIRATLNIDDISPPPPCTSLDIDRIRVSLDWRNPLDSGMSPATYFDDSTPVGAPIDGQADSIPAMPVSAWKQISGGQGSIVEVVDVSLGGGLLSNYYRDDVTRERDDTGDGQSFGDAGFQIDAPSGGVNLGLIIFVLDPNLPNTGATYQNYAHNPLLATTQVEEYQTACDPVRETAMDWEPMTPTVGQVVSFTAQAAGTEPIGFTWAFGDGTLAAGPFVTYTYSLHRPYHLALRTTNRCGQETIVDTITVLPACIPVTETVLAWEPVAPTIRQVVTFTALSTGTQPLTYTWAFGDGQLGVGALVTHTYGPKGSYEVVLSAANPCGSASPETRTIQVRPMDRVDWVRLPLVIKDYSSLAAILRRLIELWEHSTASP
jgi:hypothetical protein